MGEKQQLEQKEIEIYEEEERRRREREKEKKEDEKKKVKSESKPVTKEKATLPEKVKITIVELDKPAIGIKEIEIKKEIPEIKQEKVKIPIPIVELEKPSRDLKNVQLDYTLADIIYKERKLKIPVIKLEHPREVTQPIGTFNKEPPKIRVNEKVSNSPIYRTSKPDSMEKAVSSFDDEVDTQISQDIVYDAITKKERNVEKAKTSEVEMTSEIGEPSGGGGEHLEEEMPDIVKSLFGVPSSKLSSRGPKIILYKELENDSTIGSFETICIREYREREGGDPKYIPIKKLDDFNMREIEKWIEINGKVITIDLDSDEKRAQKLFSKERLREPLRKAIAGRVGFIIFKTRDENLYRYAKKVLENLEKEFEHPLDVVYARPKSFSFEIIKKLSSLAWGNINLEDIPPITMEEESVDRAYGSIFDDIFNKISQERFKEELERIIKKENKAIYVYATNQHEGEESDEHFLMKCFVVKLLSKQRKLKDITEIKRIIKTEEEIESVIPDIWVEDSVYEIETLFAEDREGKIPKKKIEHTIMKYENVASIREINIVLENLTFLRHLSDMIEINNVLKNWGREHGKVIRFYTIDIQNNKLISLKEVRKKIKKLYMPVSL